MSTCSCSRSVSEFNLMDDHQHAFCSIYLALNSDASPWSHSWSFRECPYNGAIESTLLKPGYLWQSSKGVQLERLMLKNVAAHFDCSDFNAGGGRAWPGDTAQSAPGGHGSASSCPAAGSQARRRSLRAPSSVAGQVNQCAAILKGKG